MRMNSTSFTHASTAMFGVAVVGYAVVRLFSYAAPHIPGHLPGHHAAPAAPQVQQIEVRRHRPDRASRSAHRSAAVTGTVANAEPAVNPQPASQSPTTAPIWPQADGRDQGQQREQEQEARRGDWPLMPSPTPAAGERGDDDRAWHDATRSTPSGSATAGAEEPREEPTEPSDD